MMHSTCMLPVERPIITSWANQAHIFSIAQRHPAFKSWLCSKYIQLELIQGWSGRDVVLNYTHIASPEEECPWLEISSTTLSKILEAGDLISFYKQALSKGTYIYQLLNQYYIPYYPYYQKMDDLHDPMIIGFDDSREVFFLADFHRNPDEATRYGVFEVTYRELEDAVCKLPAHLNRMGCIELWRYKPDVSWEFDLETAIQSLTDYLQSTYTPHREPTWLTTTVLEYGMKTYDHLLHVLEESKSDREMGDFRFFHVLSDHKQLMLLRLQYMNEAGLISQAAFDAYQELLQETSVIRNLLLKFGLSRRMSLLDRIILLLRSLAEGEQRILSTILCELKDRKDSLRIQTLPIQAG
ncbi:hypothetical protein [Paenibacillus hexagrammi]|uniref:Petrobactin biosynthesis protein AsbE n=1 Tax=Paenibacillus hexagrammi TaxID=2908839 RepID=A0ABY3SFM2_9BACL|nr:hypothetical protein [Paenibacillus sp. YPD9-1]UJF31722.1 hypothetical protein L0M14_18300 [Paenibacillus sp. YPD9-1]